MGGAALHRQRAERGRRLCRLALTGGMIRPRESVIGRTSIFDLQNRQRNRQQIEMAGRLMRSKLLNLFVYLRGQN